MNDNTTPKVLTVSGKLDLKEPYINFFLHEKPQIVLANSEDDKVIIPHDLLPESQQDAGLVVNLVEAVRHLVNTIRTLEAQRDWLAKKCEDLSDDVEDSFMPYHIPAKAWIERAKEATKE